MLPLWGTGILGTQQEFNKQFEKPINAAREKNAHPQVQELGKRRAIVITHLLKSVVLRRDSSFLKCVSANGRQHSIECCRPLFT